ncbi:MAG: hypothetical protein ACE5PV_26765, partial [Candidatus Poribacteria bacterium]
HSDCSLVERQVTVLQEFLGQQVQLPPEAAALAKPLLQVKNYSFFLPERPGAAGRGVSRDVLRQIFVRMGSDFAWESEESEVLFPFTPAWPLLVALVNLCEHAGKTQLRLQSVKNPSMASREWYAIVEMSSPEDVQKLRDIFWGLRSGQILEPGQRRQQAELPENEQPGQTCEALRRVLRGQLTASEKLWNTLSEDIRNTIFFRGADALDIAPFFLSHRFGVKWSAGQAARR